jgi:phosphoglucomutase
VYILEAKITSQDQGISVVFEAGSYFDKRQSGEEKVARLH